VSFSERLRIAGLAAERSRRAAVARLLYSPPLRWRLGSSSLGDILIVPQDLRTADPSFWHEVELGQFGLAGTVVHLGDQSPFEIEPPNVAWQRQLHSFGWIRHLEAAEDNDARDIATRLAAEWAVRYRSGTGVAWEPDVMSRRIISWLSHASFLLDGCENRLYDTVANSLGAQIVRLSATWRDAPTGELRLKGLTALLMAQLSIAGQERQIAQTQKLFLSELGKDILPDGGHTSRDASVLIELLLDFLPLRQCFTARRRTVPAQLQETMQQMIAMMRFMRLGDGRLARFNGTSSHSLAGLATVLAYDDNPDRIEREALHSGYMRLQRGASVVVVDVGPAPPLESAARAHAGCLSFEMSSGKVPIIVNCGAPAPADSNWQSAARATASHSTLCLGEQSSSQLVRHPIVEDMFGTAPIKHPARVEASLSEHGKALELNALHDGYVGLCGLIHRRSLTLHETGQRLVGVDRVEGEKVNVRLREDMSFAIHFHLHPSVTLERVQSDNQALLQLANGEQWLFQVEGARLSIEESMFFSGSSGPKQSLQLTLRNATFGDSEVRWIVEQH
jgi:uncharacterized heparinase superfamily protein